MRPSYAERPPRSLVTGQLSILLRADRPLLLISPVVMENAPRIMSLGSPVSEPRSGKVDEPDRDVDRVLTPSEEAATDASSIPDVAASSAVSPVRAPSIIPSKRTRHGDTAARSLGLDPSTPVVVEADANNGGLGRRHDPLTVTPGVYRFGAEWWQPGCERRGPADGSERLWSRATAALREVGEVTETAAVAHVCALRRRRVESGDDGGRPGSASVRARPRAAGRLGELTERWRRSSCD